MKKYITYFSQSTNSIIRILTYSSSGKVLNQGNNLLSFSLKQKGADFKQHRTKLYLDNRRHNNLETAHPPERIKMSENKIITTHNPFPLKSPLQKTKIDSIDSGAQ